MNLKMIFDTRGEIPYIQKLGQKYQQYAIKQLLTVGDFQIKDIQTNDVFVIVERKTVADLISSFSDERIYNQLNNIGEFTNISSIQIKKYLIIEYDSNTQTNNINNFVYDVSDKMMSYLHNKLQSLNIKLIFCCDIHNYYQMLFDLVCNQYDAITDVINISSSNSLEVISSDSIFIVDLNKQCFTTLYDQVRKDQQEQQCNSQFQDLLRRIFGQGVYLKIQTKILNLHQIQKLIENNTLENYLKNDCNLTQSQITQFVDIFTC